MADGQHTLLPRNQPPIEERLALSMSAERRKRSLNEPEQQDSPSAKKPRVAGVAQPSFLPPKGDLESIANAPVVTQRPAPSGAAADAIAAARAKIAAKLAAFKTGAPAPSSGSPAPAAASASQATSDIKDETSTPPPPPASGSHAAAIAEARKKIEAMKARAARSANPYLATGKAGAALEDRAPSPGQSSGIHPLLAQNDVYTARTGKDRYKPMAPKFATIKANVKQNVPVARPKYGSAAASSSKEATPGAGPSFPPGVNPYYDRSITTEFLPKERSTNKRLKFNQKGKYTRLAEQMRQEQKLEELKARIAKASMKAGLQDEIESGALIKRPAPPDVEWWDSAYLPNKTYNDIPDDIDIDNLDEKAMKHILSVLDLSSVSALIQHPIPIPAPGDKHQQAPKPLFLTKKEMKKLRRNRRAAEHKDQQDRIRMGLAPPPPDKVKISNMYRVLTQEAVQDPTKVEARVRKEMMARSVGHDKANEERKLTEEQRKEKLEKKKEQDESKGIYAAVFKIRYVSDGGHKFKVRKNADQNGLSGVLIFNPKFQLVYVEGGQKGIRQYIHLMTNRIKWTEASAAKAVNTAATPPPESAEPTAGLGAPEPEGEAEEVHNLAENYCYLVWEGQLKERHFRGFRPKACPSDAMAKEFLGEQQGLWDVAKRYDPEAEGA